MSGRGKPDDEYVDLISDDNRCAIALGTDGPSNAILRQNFKPGYTVADIVEVNRALANRGVEVANNYILITPESDLLDVVESFVMFLLLPIPWREYDQAINLRVIKEETTLATDEGVLFAPADMGYDVPLRFPEVEAFLRRHGLTSGVPSDRVRPLLWRILDEDPAVQRLLPLLIERWQQGYDDDPEVDALAKLVIEARHGAESWPHALWLVHHRIESEAFVNGRTAATFRDLVEADQRRNQLFT
jgi:hypothetical protein